MPDLADLPPPEEGGAPEGYYPDPLGGQYARWWNGSKWAHQVGPEMEPDVQAVTAEADRPATHSPRDADPRDASKVVVAAFQLYRRYPALFFALAAGVLVPFDLIVLAATGAPPYGTAAASLPAQAIIGITGWLLLGPLVSALHVHAVSDIQAGRDPELGAVARRGVKVLPVVAAATIMAGLGTVLGFVALIVPGIILLFRWFVVAQAAAIDNEGWLPALRRSRELTAGNYVHLFVFMVLLAIIAQAPALIVTGVLGMENTSAAAFLVGLPVHLFSVSFTALSTAVLFFDLVEHRRKVPDPG